MYLVIKRIGDFVFSLIGLLVLSPLLAIVAAAIKIESDGPAVFKQERLGLNGRVFKIYKFRSMCVDAEKGGVYESSNDVRVTRVGRLIRRTSIDELPQLVNILKGDMSIIGPRPTLTYHPWTIAEYSDFQRRRFDVRPGVTGWAQVNGRKTVMWEKRIELDVEYVNHLSFWFDFKIFFITIIKVLTNANNVNIGETVAKASPVDVQHKAEMEEVL